jgi:hypothetical protein
VDHGAEAYPGVATIDMKCAEYPRVPDLTESDLTESELDLDWHLELASGFGFEFELAFGFGFGLRGRALEADWRGGAQRAGRGPAEPG